MLDSERSAIRVPPRRHSALRLALFRVIERACVVCGGRAFYRRKHLGAGRFIVREEVVAVVDLPPGLEGFTVVQLSDLHAGPFLGRGDLRHVVEMANALAPHVIVITGDFITHHWSECLRTLDDCSALRARYGVFGVFGNHDYKDRLEARIADAYGQSGVRILRDECVRFGTSDGAVVLAGLEDLEEGRNVDLARARPALGSSDVEIVLCHNPSRARLLARARCAIILSGHTHGTQLDLPLLRGLGPAHPGLRVKVGSTTLVVNRGLGPVGFPLRVRAPAEIVVVRLSRESSQA